jgi:hypothetical protein
MRTLLIAITAGVFAFAGGCREDRSGEGPPPGAPTDSPQASPAPAAGHHNRIPLGEKVVGGLKLEAMMDEPVRPGGEGAFDLVITGGKPRAVRFWVGVEDARGSVKARAEEETTDNWHAHAEVPDPLPPGSQFWAEVEPQVGASFKASFNLKLQQ